MMILCAKCELKMAFSFDLLYNFPNFRDQLL